MPVFAYPTIQKLESSLRGMARIIDHKMPLVISPAEFADAFVNPDHIEKLREVRELIGGSNRASAYPIIGTPSGSVELAFNFVGGVDYLLPNYIEHGFQPTASAAAKDRIMAWVHERTRFGRALGTVFNAIEYFNNKCSDAAQLRTLVPALPTVMAEYDSSPESIMSKRAQRLNEKRKVTGLPLVPVQVRAELADACAVVNTLTLIKDAPDPQHESGTVVATLYHNKSWSYPSPFTSTGKGSFF